MPKKGTRYRQLSLDEQAQCLLMAEIRGDEKAAQHFEITVRTLQRYRRELDDPKSELSQTVAAYAVALCPREDKPQAFADWIKGQARTVSALLVEKARGLDMRNPESLRVLNEHFEAMLEHAATTDYIHNLFDREPAGEAQDDHAD